jgi:hypothetical protein
MELEPILALGSGVWIMIVVAVLVGIGLAFALSRRGSGIGEHPRGREARGGAPGAAGPSEATGQDQGELATFDERGKQ